MARKSTPAKAAPAAKAAPVTGASAKDLRRLEALKERPASSREEKKAWTEERRTLKADLAAAEREAKRGAQAGEAVVRADRKNEAEVRRLETERETEVRRAEEERGRRQETEQRLAAVERTEGSLLEQNRAQAEELDRLNEEADALRLAAREAVTARDSLAAELSTVAAARTALEKRVAALESEESKLRAALQTAQAQIESQDRPRVLPAAEVGGLVGTLLSEIRGGLPGLDVRDGEVKLRVAFAAAGASKGFVIPTAESTEQETGPLHEVAFRFDRSSPA